jgi:hypothetical protein
MDGLVVCAGDRRMRQWDAASERLRDVGEIDAAWLTLVSEHDATWDPGSRLLWAAMVKSCWINSQLARAAA